MLKGIKVLLGPSTFGALDPSPLLRLREVGCKVIDNPYKRTLSKNELIALLADEVEGLIAGLEPIDAEVLKKRLNEQSLAFIKQVREDLNLISNFTAAETEVTFKATAEKLGIGTGQVMQLFRVALTGVGGGPVLFEMMELFGKEETIKRLDNAISNFKH